MILFISITFILSVVLLISLYNLLTAPVVKSVEENRNTAFLISVLIPVRNEEHNIGKCLDHLVNQNYKNLEILVLDDQSTDKTAEVVKSFSDKHKRIKLICGSMLPEGWLGKNWACHQLSEQANGKYFLFIDADVELKENTISSIVKEIVESEVKMISVFSTQLIKSFGEWIIVPLMNWLLLAFLPLRFIYSSNKKSFVAANGQFILWDRNTYLEINGHKSVKDKVVEDMEFARICKSNNIKIKTMLGGDLVYCRMYNGLTQSINGFSKNFYPGFNVNPMIFLTMISFAFIIFILPFFLVSDNSLFIIPALIIILIRVFISTISKQNVIFNVLLHSIQMILMLIIGFKSVFNSTIGKVEWRGRQY